MSRARGFTLIELLVVLAIISALAGIGIPISRSFAAKSRQTACLGNLRQLGVALQVYLQEHNDVMPDLLTARGSKFDDKPVLEVLLLPYTETVDVFHCPEDRKEFAKTGSSYLWNTTQNGRNIAKLSFFGIRDRPEKTPIIADKEAWHPAGTNFLYGDMSSSTKLRFDVGN
jgi:prepilin-type N-terminal cleavage/methylation domain-containing protein